MLLGFTGLFLGFTRIFFSFYRVLRDVTGNDLEVLGV